MSGRRLNLTHTPAEDRGPEATGPVPPARRGQAVQGFATFYLTGAGWLKIPPGRLEISELWGGASGFGANEFEGLRRSLDAIDIDLPQVQFYINVDKPSRSYLAANRDNAEVFTFGFFGRRHS